MTALEAAAAIMTIAASETLTHPMQMQTQINTMGLQSDLDNTQQVMEEFLNYEPDFYLENFDEFSQLGNANFSYSNKF